jgi:2-polyprenyl-6-hydroxyphenyl methylase / 3-demethylubiquinone-9 3-methyltransferase
MGRKRKPVINNEIYNTLGERWYTAEDSPVAILRSEGKLKNPWVIERIKTAFGTNNSAVLDIGCGAGFLTNELARMGFAVSGIDLSHESLTVARQFDTSGSAHYVYGNAYNLPYQDVCFDAVCCMDFLEHIEQPDRVISEASRVLKFGGLFFFHTFNRTLLSWLVAVKGLEWFVRNTPPNLHVYRLFLKPEELRAMCIRHGLVVQEIIGIRPSINRAFWQLLVNGHILPEFKFELTSSLAIGYLGFAKKAEVTPEAV